MDSFAGESHEPFTVQGPALASAAAVHADWEAAEPFRHVVVDDFLPAAAAVALSSRFPSPDHPVWLDWKVRSPHQYGKQGPGNSERFGLLDPWFNAALQEFNGWRFLQYLASVTGIADLLPDPYFTGGGIHQILSGGLLDIHTDFNYYERLKTYRRLNALLYLTEDWRPEYGGQLELWTDSPKRGGRCFREIAPSFNRLVVFETDKNSFHGHPREWSAPARITRRSIALYYYTATPVAGKAYDQVTDFQSYAVKPLPTA